jgi:hypothetical protein
MPLSTNGFFLVIVRWSDLELKHRIFHTVLNYPFLEIVFRKRRKICCWFSFGFRDAIGIMRFSFY